MGEKEGSTSLEGQIVLVSMALTMNDRIKEGARRLIMALTALLFLWIVYRIVTRTAVEGDFFWILFRWPFLVLMVFVPLVIYRTVFWKRTWFRRNK